MATVLDILTRAARKATICAEDEDLDAGTASNLLTAFNDMLHEWKLRGVDVSHSDLAATDTFPLADQYRSGTVHMLARYIAPDYVVPTNFDPDDFFRAIQAAYMTIGTATMPNALTIVPSRLAREGGYGFDG